MFLLLVSAMVFSAGQTMSEPSVQKALPPDILEKHNHYMESFVTRHMYKGGTAEAELDDSHTAVVKYVGLGDSQGWTGLTMSAFALDERWDLVRDGLRYWEEIEVEPGRYKRWPEIPDDYGHGQTSIDQYGEMLMGMAEVALHGPPELRNEIARITRNIIVYGKAHNWIYGEGPWTDCTDLKLLFQLLAEKLEIDVDIYGPGETFDSEKEKFFLQFKQAYLIRTGSVNYFSLNLMFERLFVAKILRPELTGLDDMIKTWFKPVRKDGNPLFNWFYGKVFGLKTDKLIKKELRAFPAELPNRWKPTGYHWGYRWERSPKEWETVHPISNIEHPGMDFIVLASYYSFYKYHNFDDEPEK